MKALEKVNNCEHLFKWHNTSIGGFAQCEDCNIVDTKITEDQCIDYITPKELADFKAKQKVKRREERERIKQATIDWLKRQGDEIIQ